MRTIAIRAIIMLLLLPVYGVAQILNKSKADSLIAIYNSDNRMSDSAEFELLQAISEYSTSPSEALRYANEAFLIADKNNNNRGRASSTLMIGQAYEMLGDVAKALASLFESARYYEKSGLDLGVSSAYMAIGNVYQTQGNMENSLRYYNKSIELLYKTNDSITLATVLLNTGELYRISNVLDTALQYFNESMTIFQEKDFEIGMAYGLGNTGLIYAETGQHEKAEKALNKAVQMLKEAGDYYPIATYYLSMADAYMNKKLDKQALNYAYKSYRIAAQESLKEELRDACLKLSELYQNQRNSDSAFFYYKTYILYRDSIYNLENIRQTADMRTAYEVSQKQAEVDLLNKTKKIQQLITLGILGILLLISTLAVVVFRNFKRNKKYNRLLTEQKTTLQEQRDQLDKLNQTKDKFFSIISHDLRGPIGAIMSVSSMLKESIDDKEQLVEIAGFMEGSSSKISSLLTNLLSWAVQQQGQFPYSPEKLNINQLLDEVREIYTSMAGVKQIKLSRTSSEEVLVWADRNSVLTIFRNLVNNALKFTKTGGKVSMAVLRKEEYAEIHVADDGVGMPKEKLETVFAFREKKSTNGTSNEKGLGLGLSLVYEFTEMNKGKIRVESEEGTGTTFIVSLPLAEIDEQSLREEPSLVHENG